MPAYRACLLPLLPFWITSTSGLHPFVSIFTHACKLLFVSDLVNCATVSVLNMSDDSFIFQIDLHKLCQTNTLKPVLCT